MAGRAVRGPNSVKYARFKSANTAIVWIESTRNPLAGCTKNHRR
jgi:hypothetical protein